MPSLEQYSRKVRHSHWREWPCLATLTGLEPATSAFEVTRFGLPAVEQWVVGSHSLGGLVAAIQTDDGDSDVAAPVVGLFFYASLPASEVSSSLTARMLSLSAANDGLATPVDIDAAKLLLPSDTNYIVIPGAVQAFLGDYGAQPGDGIPAVSRDKARSEITQAKLDFVREVSGK